MSLPYGAIDAWVNADLGGAGLDVPTLEYLFPGVVERCRATPTIDGLLREMDTAGVERVVLCGGYAGEDGYALMRDGVRRHPDRFCGSVVVDPRRGMAALRDLTRAVEEEGFRFARAMGLMTLLPYDDAVYYPLYAKCIELDVALGLNVGIPGPPVPGRHQDPMAIDTVCAFFPELRVVMAHGGVPWADVCVRLMEKWPNLSYMSSAFSPRYIPEEIIAYANTRGAARVMWATDFPLLPFDRGLREIAELPFRDEERRRRFARDNALELFFGATT